MAQSVEVRSLIISHLIRHISTSTSPKHFPFILLCPTAYIDTLNENSVIADINECSLNNGGCSQTCIDLQPDYTRDQTEGFRCLCAAGFIMAVDGTTCQGNICYYLYRLSQ